LVPKRPVLLAAPIRTIYRLKFRSTLINYVAYAHRHNVTYSAVEYHAISHLDLEQAARKQGVAFKQGDILLVRIGVINDITSAPTPPSAMPSSSVLIKYLWALL
jgi:hypothetical protein